MILILSKSTMEASTDEVIDWLKYLGADFVRVNGKDLVDNQAFSIAKTTNGHFTLRLQRTDTPINLADVDVVWYRRWSDSHTLKKLQFTNDKGLENDINNHRQEEFKALTSYFFSFLQDVPVIGASAQLVKIPSKFQQLRMAEAAGIEIPATVITNRKEELLDFYHTCNNALIVKAMGEAGVFGFDDKFYAGYTALLTEELLNTLPEQFYPSLFQEAIQKEFELRIFYLEGDCHAMAIFSSLDPQTAVDFRKYNNKKPNRNVPYQLPAALIAKIDVMMRSLHLNTGSIDIIYTTDGRYVFLEVNPGGQFGMTSRPCNYFLERKMARLLIEKSQQ